MHGFELGGVRMFQILLANEREEFKCNKKKNKEFFPKFSMLVDSSGVWFCSGPQKMDLQREGLCVEQPAGLVWGWSCQVCDKLCGIPAGICVPSKPWGQNAAVAAVQEGDCGLQGRFGLSGNVLGNV